MQKIGDKYMAEHPGIRLEWNFASGWQDKLTTLISAGLSPDVTYTNWVGLPNLARSGALLPLDPLAQKEVWSRSQFVPAMWDAVWHDGRMYAVPGGGDYIALYSNKDVFAETGLDPERPPRTVWDLEPYSDKIIRTNGQGNLIRLGYAPGDFLYWASIFGGQFYDDSLRRVTLNHPRHVEA